MSAHRRLFELTREGGGPDGPIVIRVTGEVDFSVAEEFRAALGVDGVDASGGVLLDLDAVAFMDSSALHSVLRFRAELESSGIPLRVIARDSTPVAQLLDFSGLRDRLPRSKTVEEGVQALG